MKKTTRTRRIWLLAALSLMTAVALSGCTASSGEKKADQKPPAIAVETPKVPVSL